MEFSWSSKNHLVLASSAKCKENKSFSANIVTLHFGYELECYRRLANEFYNVFQKRKSIASEYSCILDGQPIGSHDLQKLSVQYQLIIEAVSNNLNEDDRECQLDILRNARLIWSLIDALLLRSADTLPSGDLAEWSSNNFKSEQFGENVWDKIYLDLCLANVDACVKNLETLLISRTDPFFRRFFDHIRSMPSVYENEKLEWVKWQQMSKQLADENHLAADQQIALALELMSGQEEAFKLVGENFALKFYQILPGFVLFSNKFAKIYELFDYAQAARKLVPSTNQSLTDDIFSSIFELDVINMIKLCSAYFNNWLFVAHLVDLLKYAGCADLKSIAKGHVDLSEYIIFEYADSLMSHESLWQLAVEYFLACPVYGIQALRLHIERLASCQNDHKTLKLLAICRKCEFDDLAQNIIKQRCIENLKNNMHSKALSWCLQSEDPGIVTLVAEQILDSCQNLNNDDLIDCLNSLMSVVSPIYTSNATLLFLRKYKDVRELQKDRKLKEAVDLLAQLLILKASPRRFWLNLLEDLLFLLKDNYKENLFEKVDVLHNLIIFVETLHIEIEKLKNLHVYVAKYDERRLADNYFHNLMHDLRLYLNKCRTICDAI